MGAPLLVPMGSFAVGGATAAGNTAYALMVPPFANQAGAGLGTAIAGKGVTHITSIICTNGATAQTLVLMRPLNYTTFSADAAAAQTTVSLTADPGLYTTNFKYPLVNATTPSTANNAIASGDYVVYQSAAGQYVMDTANGSYSSGTVALTTNLPTGGVKKGGLFWWYGISTDINPQTNLAHFGVSLKASTVVNYTDPSGLFCTLNPGDPLVLYNANATNASTLDLVCGFYSKH